jgi:CBS-domain-containing membrane protein
MRQLDSSVWILAVCLCVAALAAIVVIARKRREWANRRGPANASRGSKTRGSGVFQKRQEILNTLSSDMSSLLLNSHLEVRHLMSPRVKSVSPETPRAEIEALMTSAEVRHLMVCRDNGELAGIISDRDVKQQRGQTAADLMTKNPGTVGPHTPIPQIITMMIDRKISCVPVVDEGGLHGVLTTTDLLLALQCSLRLFEQLSGRLVGGTAGADAANGAIACGALQSVS